jgi:hypothetical protein
MRANKLYDARRRPPHPEPDRARFRGTRSQGSTARRHPAFERLEGRELLSGTLPPSARTNRDPLPNPAVIQQAIQLLYGPDSATPQTPTPHEIRRETIVARWVGNYTVGAPRLNDRFSTIHLWSKDGGSNQFLKGKFQMALFPPADPGATPNPGNPYANQVTGVAGLFTQNFLQTGGLIVADVNGMPAPGSSPAALPTHLTWVYDINSAGPYAAVGYTTTWGGFSQGTGTIDIKYIPDRVHLRGTEGSGRMIVTLQGLLNFNQINSAISRPYM